MTTPLDPPSPDRQRGAFIGLAVGDAVGTTLEFRAPGTFTPIDDMLGGGPFRLPPRAWTDDTSMAARLAESLIERSSTPKAVAYGNRTRRSPLGTNRSSLSGNCSRSMKAFSSGSGPSRSLRKRVSVRGVGDA